jgi:ATP-dependent DNA helicase RecQ
VEGDYGTLVLTDDSAEVLGRRRDVMMRREPEGAARSSRSSGKKKGAVVDLAPEAAPVFERLRIGEVPSPRSWASRRT